jgi:putative SOS response-associated peptidase YedK
MCGRAYSTFTDEELALRYLGKKGVKFPRLRPNYNMSPSHEVPVVKVVDGERSIELHRWGLVPFWAKDIKIGYKMINARSETVTEKPAFRNAFQKRRCIVPLSGFIEWKRQGESKRPFRISLKDAPIMSVAGIWETWKDEDVDATKEIHSFSVLTTSANSFMEKIHDRMPVILDPKNEEAWLDPENQKIEALTKLLKPCPSAWLEACEVSTLINSPRNNSEEVLKPLVE